MREKLMKQIEKLKKLIELYMMLIELKKKKKAVQKDTDMNEVIYRISKSYVGKKIRTVGRLLACANSLDFIIEKATGNKVGGDDSTGRMYNILRKDKQWEQVYIPQFGDLMIAPTGFKVNWRKGHNGIKHGHCWIFGDSHVLYSNNSKTGLWDDHWTLDNALAYYRDKGNYPVTFWRYK